MESTVTSGISELEGAGCSDTSEVKSTYCCVISKDGIVVTNIADSSTSGVVSNIGDSDASGVVNIGCSDNLGVGIAG